ncbi:ead/Ea22-like family protein [Salmonella enterica]|nr:ead/Ea22-like family protein [Salmonella enterica]ECS6876171.1 ead/Ea22-like family protein [Salmonella enterica subsp. enterica serovar Richmond]EAQ4571999.1 ead/Ea22-like family protein [Salmonella enterica]EBC3087648.1 ead/Ea22-like family protein [Salmonella enterica]EBD5591313.1 ead/Ea22-like family protein [Salmonella enterica]
MNIDKQALLVSKAKASVFTMVYISQFEASDIDSDDIDLRFEVDGVETGTTVSIVDECGHAAQIITALLDELEHYKSREERVTKLVMDNSTSWDALYKKLEAAEKRIAEQSAIVAAAEKLVRCKGRYHSELNYRALAKLFGVITPDLPPLEHENVHYADAAEVEITALRQRIAELEARKVNLSKLSVGEVMHMSGFSRDYAEGWCAGNDNAIHEIRTAGIKVKGD